MSKDIFATESVGSVVFGNAAATSSVSLDKLDSAVLSASKLPALDFIVDAKTFTLDNPLALTITTVMSVGNAGTVGITIPAGKKVTFNLDAPNQIDKLTMHEGSSVSVKGAAITFGHIFLDEEERDSNLTINDREKLAVDNGMLSIVVDAAEAALEAEVNGAAAVAVTDAGDAVDSGVTLAGDNAANSATVDEA